MKYSIRAEEALMFLGSAFILYWLELPWWIYLVLLLGPDISMLGYASGNKTGAMLYNLFHHKGVALAVAFAGFGSGNHELMVAGIILFGHSSMDRMFGYGLKYTRGFKFTHLGEIGNLKNG